MSKLTLVFPLAAICFSLLVFYESVPLLHTPLTDRASDRRMTGRDRALCLLITFAGGWTAFFVLAATFLLTVAADKLAGSRADPHGLRRKSGRRDAVRK